MPQQAKNTLTLGQYSSKTRSTHTHTHTHQKKKKRTGNTDVHNVRYISHKNISKKNRTYISTIKQEHTHDILLWPQWMPFESLLNDYLHVVFYMYMHVFCPHNDDKHACKYCTCTVSQCVLHWGCCWTATNFTIACTLHIHLYCTVLIIFLKFTLHDPVHRMSHISLWSTRKARHQSQNSAAAQPLIEIKQPHPKTVPSKTLTVTNRSNKQLACCPRGRGQEADWRPEVSMSACWSRRKEGNLRLYVHRNH